MRAAKLKSGEKPTTHLAAATTLETKSRLPKASLCESVHKQVLSLPSQRCVWARKGAVAREQNNQMHDPF